MAYCPQCGGASSGAFCPQCGSPMAAASPQTAPQTAQGFPPQQPQPYPRPARRSKGLLIGLGVGGGLLAVAIVVLALLASDGGSSTKVTSPAGNSSVKSPSGTTTTSAGKVTRKPGYITGMVLDEQGNPLKVSSDKIQIRISGNRTDMQEVAGFATVSSDGRFETKVPEGNYSVSGSVRITFDGTEFLMPLEAVGGAGPESSKAGIAKEMRLKLNGLKPIHTSTENPYSYYGGHIVMVYQGITLPNDAKVTFTLTPTTSLADGSQGKPLTFSSTGKELKSTAYYLDIPLAKYRITGQVSLPDGKKKVALIRGADTKPAPALEFGFRPSGSASLGGLNATFLWMEGEQ